METFPELKAMNFRTERVHWGLRTINKKQTIPRQTTVKCLNIGNKEKYLKKSQREKIGHIPKAKNQQGFPKSTLKSRRFWSSIINISKSKNIFSLGFYRPRSYNLCNCTIKVFWYSRPQKIYFLYILCGKLLEDGFHKNKRVNRDKKNARYPENEEYNLRKRHEKNSLNNNNGNT